ncbi:MAG: DUF4105 domain-containing protein [Muribaculaceae bacterium]|nr:DUF4105 domain-containing protein [Muribaculaceae bacterium]
MNSRHLRALCAVIACSLLFAVNTLAVSIMPNMAEDTTVSLVTFYPGSDIYELEGHSALRLRTPMSDVAVSYGMFDFDAPNFVYRFVKGETDYSVGIIPWPAMEAAYRMQGRRIVERQIDMTPEQKQRLFSIVQRNLLPENRTYRYNYVLDNCATRPLAAVQEALGDSIILAEPDSDIAELTTWRRIMQHYHRNYPWYQFGIDIALGSGIDRPVSNREKAFAPVVLDMQIEDATAGGRPVVDFSTVLCDTAPDAAVLAPTPWYATPMAVCWTFFAITLTVSIFSWWKRRRMRGFDTFFFSVEFLASLLVWFLVFVSEHEATSPNYLALWLNPSLGAIAVCVWIKRAEKLVMWLKIANFALLTASLALCLVLGQHINAAMWPLAACQALRCLPLPRAARTK